MSVCLGCIAAMEMLPAIILMEAIPVCAMKVIMEMVKYAHLLVRLYACDNLFYSKILSDLAPNKLYNSLVTGC